jgi:hypothetical protein
MAPHRHRHQHRSDYTDKEWCDRAFCSEDLVRHVGQARERDGNDHLDQHEHPEEDAERPVVGGRA